MTTPQQRAHNGEAGFMLLAVIVMVALVLLALSVAAPVVARDLRRDKEVESVHRAEQYVRAIRIYQRACKCTSYPPSMDALEKGTAVRYLRQKYVDPLTGKSDWRLIHQPKTTIKIPFGQELSGLSGGGLGSAAGMSSGVGTPVGGGSSSGGTTPLGAGFGDSSSTSGSNPSSSSGGSSFGSSSGSSGSSFGSSSSSSGTGTGSSSGTSGSSSGSSSGTGMFGDSSGGVIYGVGTSRSGTSILNPNQQTTYETWEFWYDPRIERLYAMANLMGGGGIGSQSASSFGQSATSGQPNSGSSSSSGGTNPTSGSSPTSGTGSSSPTFP